MWPSEFSTLHSNHVNVKTVGSTRHHILCKILSFLSLRGFEWDPLFLESYCYYFLLTFFESDALWNKKGLVSGEWLKNWKPMWSYIKFLVADINIFFSALYKYKLVNPIYFSNYLQWHNHLLGLLNFLLFLFYVSKQIPNFIGR